jgi:hypothetical protein
MFTEADNHLDNMDATYVCMIEFKLELKEEILEKKFTAEGQLHQRFVETAVTS